MRHHIRKIILGIAIITMATMLMASQTPGARKPAFEVASIKLNRSGSSYSTSNGFQACRFVADNATLKMMMVFAYRLPNGQVLPADRVIGDPAWMDTDHFDVEAKRGSVGDSISLDEFLLMVQSLLEDRFRLRTHWSKRDLPVYDLVVAKDGPKLKRSENKTQLPPPARNPVLRCSGTPVGPPPPVQSTGSRGGTLPRAPITEAYDASGVSITGTGVTVSTLISLLRGYIDRPIMNKTGLSALYDLKLRFSAERPGVGQLAPITTDAPLAIGQAAPAAAEPSGPSIFTAIQELGLKLEAAKAPLEVLVIDSVQRPTEN